MKYLAVALIAAAAAFLLRGMLEKPVVMYRNVEVPVPVIQEVERVDTLIKFVERIKYVTVKAEQIATAPGGGQVDVERFCGPAVPPDSTVEAPALPPQFLMRSFRLEDAWFFGKDKLIITGPTSNGDLRQMTYGTRGSVQAHVHGDTAIVQYPRTAQLKQITEYGIVAAIVYGLTQIF